MEGKCELCNNVASFHGIINGEILKICENCAKINNAIIIRKPTEQQLANIYKAKSVYERLARSAGYKQEKKEEKMRETVKQDAIIRPRVWKIAEEKQQVSVELLKKEKEREMVEKARLLLVENWNSIVAREREKRGLSRKKLAEEIAEQESVIAAIESARLPADAKRVLRKLEQFFRIKLIKEEKEGGEWGEEKERGEKSNGGKEEIRISEEGAEIDFRSKNLTIEDLRKVKEKLEKL